MKITRIQIISNIIALVPGIAICTFVVTDSLSANPIQTATVITGRAAVYFLLFSLFCTPLNNFLKMSAFIRMRKTFGLYTFFYALAHFLIFSVLDFEMNLAWITPEISQKPFLKIGLAALVLLIPLAVSSFSVIKRALGVWWKRIHLAVYLISGLVILHVALASKGDIIDPLILTGVFITAMVLRLPLLKKLVLKNPPEVLRKLNTFLIQPLQR